MDCHNWALAKAFGTQSNDHLHRLLSWSWCPSSCCLATTTTTTTTAAYLVNLESCPSDVPDSLAGGSVSLLAMRARFYWSWIVARGKKAGFRSCCCSISHTDCTSDSSCFESCWIACSLVASPVSQTGSAARRPFGGELGQASPTATRDCFDCCHWIIKNCCRFRLSRLSTYWISDWCQRFIGCQSLQYSSYLI